MAHLNQIIPDPAKRKPIYRVFAAVGIALTAAQVGVAAIPDTTQPVALTVALAVYAFLATAGFALADSNTPAEPVEDTSAEFLAEIDDPPRHAE